MKGVQMSACTENTAKNYMHEIKDAVQTTPYLPYTEDPSAYLEAMPEEEGSNSASERISKLLEQMPSMRRTICGLISFCCKERTADEVAKEVERLQRHAFSVYDAPALCALLQRAGALRMEKADQLDPQVVEMDGIRYIQPVSAQATFERWIATEEGLSVLQNDDAALGRFWKLLKENARYEHIYRSILECCSNEKGATVQQLSDAVDDDPELQEPRLYAQYFCEGLADCDLVEWSGAWCITDLGRKAVEMLDG